MWLWAGHRQQLTSPCTTGPPKRSKTSNQVASFRSHQMSLKSSLQMTHPRGGLSKHPNSSTVNTMTWGQHPHISSSTVDNAIPHSQWASWGGQSHPTIMPTAIKVQLQQESTHYLHKEYQWSTWLRWLGRLTALLGPTEHLIHKATLPRLVNIVYIPNT